MLTLEAERLNPDVYWPLAKPLARSPLYHRLVAAAPRAWAYAAFYAVGACEGRGGWRGGRLATGP